MIMKNSWLKLPVAASLVAMALAMTPWWAANQALATPVAADCDLELRYVSNNIYEGAELLGVAAPGDVWAGGRVSEGAGMEHWVGTRWVGTPVDTDANGTVSGMAIISPNDIWAVGEQFEDSSAKMVEPLALHWDGTSWKYMVIAGTSVPNAYGPDQLTAASASGPNDVWAVGKSIYHYNGQAWQAYDTDSLLGGSTLLSVVALKSNDAWAVGGALDLNGNISQSVVLHWNGTAWTNAQSTMPAGFMPLSLAATHGQTGIWAMGNGSAHWDGQHWAKVAVPTTQALQTVAVTPEGEAWAISASGRDIGGSKVLRWDGSSWRILDDGAGTVTYKSLAVEAPGDTWIFSSHFSSMPRGGSSTSRYVQHAFKPCLTPAAPASDPKQDGVLFYPEVNHTLRGEFRTYWEQHGGLAQFGYPITEQFQEKSETDGKLYTVQYFQRNRFEYHPENQKPYDVLLGLLGRTFLDTRGGQTEGTDPVDQPVDGTRYFPQTRHTLGAQFADYWEQHGGLAVYGYPISEPIQEYSITDNKPYLVQYFERNRLEYHPENQKPYDILLGLLGTDTLKGRGWIAR